MANNPTHTIGLPLGISFTNPKHDSRNDVNLSGYYDTLSDLVVSATNVPSKDQSYLTYNDWLYAARLQNGDI